MGADLHVIMEVKVNDVWKTVLKESVLRGDTLMPIIFCQRFVCGGYNSDLIPFINDGVNGSPDNISGDTKAYLEEGSWDIDGYVTKESIENFNWKFNIPYQLMTSPESKAEFTATGKIPQDLCTSCNSWVDIEFEIPFMGKYNDFFSELEYLRSLGEDYRYLYYFE